MKRGYTREEFITKLEKLTQINPLAFIGTDVIVGYLEESDKDFADTLDFLSRTPIAKFHVFRFSKRQHTAAFYLSKRLREPAATQKSARAKALTDLSARKYAEFQTRPVSKTFTALILQRRKDDYQQALLSNQLPVYIKIGKDLTGQIHAVKVIDHKNSQLFGRIA